MTDVETILVATDFSTCSDSALEYARGLADRLGAALHVVHVVTEPLHESWASYSPGAAFLDLVEKLERDARDRMRQLLRGSNPAAGPAVVAALWGDPAEQILQYARDHRVSLIVCGTHGRRGVERMVLGSVAERIVRLAPCPVLTVHGPAAGIADVTSHSARAS